MLQKLPFMGPTLCQMKIIKLPNCQEKYLSIGYRTFIVFIRNERRFTAASGSANFVSNLLSVTVINSMVGEIPPLMVFKGWYQMEEKMEDWR